MNEHAWKRFCNPKAGETLDQCEKRLADARKPENVFPTKEYLEQMDTRVYPWRK